MQGTAGRMWRRWVPLGAVIGLAAALRFYALGQLPPGLYHDEAYNGLDALWVLAGARPVFFKANNGREPLFIYLVAASVAVLGRSPLAVRLVSAILGTLTVPATYLMTRALSTRRVALLAAAVTAVAVWPLGLSRVGFRTVAMPLFIALALWQLWSGCRTRRARSFAWGGLFYGLTFYTYLAARFTPVALLACGATVVAGASSDRKLLPRRGLLIFVGIALLVAAPLMGYTLTHWDTVAARSYQVSVLNPDINEGHLASILVRHVGRTLLMFTARGDFIPRHNVPHRPVFDPLMGLAFLLGLAVALRHWREPENAFVFVWTAVMLLPTVLAEDAPHFLRAVGVLPVLFVLPALGLDAVWRFVAHRSSATLATTAVLLALTVSLGATVRDYFFRYAPSQAAYYNFEAGATELATEVNRFLGQGWTGTGPSRLGAYPAPGPQGAGRRVYLARRFWEGWASLRFLIPPSPELILVPDQGDPEPLEGDDLLLILWPYEDNATVLRRLPPEVTVQAREGAWERGDLDPKARLLYVTVRATKGIAPPGNVSAAFEEGIRLAGYRLDALPGNELRIGLYWQSTSWPSEDYTVFVHVLGPEGLVAQDDARPVQGYYPTSLWRAGDTVLDEHVVSLGEPFDPARHRIVVGLYQLETLERLKVLDDAGHVIGDSVHLTWGLP